MKNLKRDLVFVLFPGGRIVPLSRLRVDAAAVRLQTAQMLVVWRIKLCKLSKHHFPRIIACKQKRQFNNAPIHFFHSWCLCSLLFHQPTDDISSPGDVRRRVGRTHRHRRRAFCWLLQSQNQLFGWLNGRKSAWFLKCMTATSWHGCESVCS